MLPDIAGRVIRAESKMVDLSGRVAIVTGAGSGLGREHALLLAARGAKVVVNDLSETPAEEVAEEIRKAGSEAVAVAASVTDFDAMQAMVAKALERWSRVDILVNNAGIESTPTLAKVLSEEQWDRVLAVNLKGPFLCCTAVIPTMI